jgi:dynein heavy chain
MNYGYEFCIILILEGCFSRLVITPLTERCFLTVTFAFHNKMGANPSGPAGTGKTETCKDMAKVLGR